MSIDTRLYKELFRVSDEMRVAVYDPPNLTVRKMINLSNQLCGQLSAIKDEEINDLVGLFSEIQSNSEIQEQQQEILNDASIFIKFLSVEYKILRHCGVPNQLANDVVSSIAIVRNKLEPVNFDGKSFLDDFRNIRKFYCEGAKEMRAHERRLDSLREMEKSYYRNNGLLCALANGSVLAISMGLAAPFMGLSGTAGAYLIREGLTLPDELDERLRR